MMPLAHILGFPRIGAKRELKFALEAFWRGEIAAPKLQSTGRELRARHWELQRQAGLDYVTVGDFAWYDQVLNMVVLLGCAPARFAFDPTALTLEQYFILARGNKDHLAMEMTKWFDTNYHYLVPEFLASTSFDGGVDWLFAEIDEAQSAGYRVKPALLGPLSLLYLAKMKDRSDKLALLPCLIAAYQRILGRLNEMGVEWVQIDEPVLGLDLEPAWLAALPAIYSQLQPGAPKLLLATYFESVEDHADVLKTLAVSGLHLDLVRAPGQLTEFLRDYPQDKVFSAGIVDGRNIWRADLDSALAALTRAYEVLGERLWVAPSCSLLHVPVDLQMESKLEPEIREWLAFAVQKIEAVVTLKHGLSNGVDAVSPLLAAARVAGQKRQASSRVRDEVVRRRVAALTPQASERAGDFATRIAKQRARLNLPLLPTTTIGSFPQTEDIRKTRAAFKQGQISNLKYLDKMRSEIRFAIEKQNDYGIDVLVHGEPERNDMVEYFAEQLWGYAFTENGWVQSYGSRCVKPPLLYGDVYRPEPMTVEWITYAQSLAKQPVKGMLTGPVTMLQWSFVRDDQPREVTALQIALALRDEVCDLEKAGIAIIQIDEPAFREGLPLKKRDWQRYLDWATQAFRVSAAAVNDATQIHTHMCYSEFNDILPAIAALDADVITIETSRSDMELLEGFGEFDYPNEIGPGVYDIHSPRSPRVEEMVRLIDKARQVIPARRLWVNPDCGLKTRTWEETDAALCSMVQAARIVRQSIKPEGEADKRGL